MAELVLLVLGVAATLYAVLAGADFGAGVLEVFLDDEASHRVDVALAPVWEANHVWLVLVVVLAFVGFPEVYATSTTYLHLPLLGVLLGIVLRGTAFTFRHYDPSPGAWSRAYTMVFRASSLVTPLFLGITAAAVVEVLRALYDDMVGRRGMSDELAKRSLSSTEPFQNYPDLVAALPGCA